MYNKKKYKNKYKNLLIIAFKFRQSVTLIDKNETKT